LPLSRVGAKCYKVPARAAFSSARLAPATAAEVTGALVAGDRLRILEKHVDFAPGQDAAGHGDQICQAQIAQLATACRDSSGRL
jgi:hypothetical protein